MRDLAKIVQMNSLSGSEKVAGIARLTNRSPNPDAELKKARAERVQQSLNMCSAKRSGK